MGNPCGDVDHTICQNTEGGFACVCVAGFAFNDVTGLCEGGSFIHVILLNLYMFYSNIKDFVFVATIINECISIF